MRNSQATCSYGVRLALLSLAAAAVVVASLVPAPAPRAALAEPSASAETESALSDAQARLETAQADLQVIGDELEALDLALGETMSQVAEVSTRIDETTAQIGVQESDLLVAREHLREVVSTAYKRGGTNLFQVLLSSESLETFVSNLYYLDKVAQNDQEIIDEVVRLRDELAQQKTSLEAERANLETLLETQERQVAEVQAKQAEAEAYIAGLDDEVSELLAQRQAEIEAAAEEERRLAAEAAARAAEEQAAREAAEAAARAAAEAQGSQASDDASSQQVPSGSEVSSGTRAAVIDYGLSLLGVPYVYGGTYPQSGGTDCSGFTMWAFSQVGISIPRTTYAQLAACKAAGHFTTDLSQMQPGDLVFTNGGGHVAIYIGNGNCVHEPTPGDVCSIAPLTRWSDIVGCGFPA